MGVLTGPENFAIRDTVIVCSVYISFYIVRKKFSDKFKISKNIVFIKYVNKIIKSKESSLYIV